MEELSDCKLDKIHEGNVSFLALVNTYKHHIVNKHV